MADKEITLEWIDGPDSPGPRPATKAEWDAIDDVCAAQGWMSLNRMFSRVLVARRSGEMIGFHVMQLVPHAEPAWVAEGERGTGLPATMADQMVEFLTESKALGWLVLAGNSFTEKLCEERGMKRIASAVYRTQ